MEPIGVNGGKALAASLAAENVKIIFTVSGGGLNAFYAACPEYGIRVVHNRHEYGAAFMADGYARASGKVGVALVITGPGLTNASTGLGQAYADGVPLLIVSSEVDSRYKGRGNLHELKDQQGMLRSITLSSTRAESVSEIPRLIHQAMERYLGKHGSGKMFHDPLAACCAGRGGTVRNVPAPAEPTGPG